MKPPSLSPKEIYNLSKLLISSDSSSIEVAFQILYNYKNAVQQVSKELVLISQLSWDDSQRKEAIELLETHFDTAQIKVWNDTFQVFHIYQNLFDFEDFEENWHWFEIHETHRAEYMPFIRQNIDYTAEYFAIAETIAEYYKTRLDWAERYYKISLEYNPNDLNTLSTLATLYKDGYQDYSKALALYDQMLKIEPQHYDALEAKGALFLDYIKDIDTASATFKTALKHHPKDETLQIWLADSYMQKNSSELLPRGKEMLERILEKSPQNTFAWTIYGNRLWITENKPEEAIKAYQNGLKANPRSYNILGNLAELYERVYKDYEQAKDYYVKAFSIYMDDAFHLSNYVRLLVLCTKEFDDAKDYYQHLKGLFFGTIKREPELNDAQWEAFQEAEKILWTLFPELKES
ncbi:MAG: tetratricopeptide repeat protein [Aureispira sp.]|nr:tetratricopeptide repeat protein [Aureispira sp.]